MARADTPPGRAPRTNLFIGARLTWRGLGGRGQEGTVLLRNLSPDGALVEGPVLPAPGTAVRLSRGALTATGSVMWSDAQRGGVWLDERIDVAAWMAPPGARSAASDQVPAGSRAAIGSGAALRALSVEHEPPERRRASVGDEVAAIERLVAELSADLVAEPEPSVRHFARREALQRIAGRLEALRGRVG